MLTFKLWNSVDGLSDLSWCHREFLDTRFSPFMALVFPFALLPSNAERGAELLLGQAPRMGVNFSHSRQKFRRRPATI